MPVVPAGDLTNLRSSPQMSTLYLVIQQPARYTVASDTFTVGDFVWYGTVRVAPAADPITSLEVTAHADASGVTILDGMTIMISNSAYGKWERGIIAAHGDQTILGAGNDDTLYISVASDLSAVDVGDFVVVLDEFRFRTLYPKVTLAAGVLSWFKYYGFFLDSIGEAGGDIGYTWAQLGAADANRRGASMPPVPIMSSHVVQFIDPDVGNVTINFDWTDSYALAPGAAVDAWASVGENDHVGGSWNSAAQNPAAQTYSVLSGLRGFRTTLELGTDGDDPIVEFRRGVRYVFTLRRPSQAQVGDPADAAPITDFMVDSISGSFDQGGWRTTVTVFENQASEFQITPGALVIIFSEDTYGSTKTSIGPDDSNFTDRENIILVGHIADDSIRKDAETGDVTFDVVSVSELMKNRECYPVVIENDGGADEWYKTPTLTVDRASHHYLRWQTNLCLIADLYQTGDTKEVRAMDFMAGDAYSTVDTFIQDRLFARLLCDRFGRFAMVIDQQLETAAGAAALFTLADTDWMEEASLRQVNEPPVSVADTGGLFYNGGLVRPYLSHAPGEVSGYVGTPEQRVHLAISSQAQLNTVCGRLYTYRNNEWPELVLPYAGNWRVFDIWPQEYVSVSLTTERHAFSSDLFIVREISFDYDPAIGVLFTTVSHELETDGPDGVTVTIPAELPTLPNTPTTSPPTVPPTTGAGGEDVGRRIISTNVGVFVTDNIGDVTPYWYAANAGLIIADSLIVYSIPRDPFHWWTSGGTERRLWAGTNNGIWMMDDFPNGTWVNIVTSAAIVAAIGHGDPAATSRCRYCRVNFSIETEGQFSFIFNSPGGFHFHALVVQDGVITSQALLENGSSGSRWPDIKYAQHSAWQTIYASIPRLDTARDLQLWRTLNNGAAWTRLEQFGNAAWVVLYTSISIPYVDVDNPDSFVLYGGEDFDYRISINGGASFNSINDSTGYYKIGTGGTPDRIFLRGSPSKWSADGGVTYTELPGGEPAGPAAHVIWSGDVLDQAIVGSESGSLVYYWRQGLAAWQDKSGNLPGYGVTAVYDIQRDSMGAP